MKKIVALFTAVMFSLTLGVAFAQTAAPAPEKKAEEKAPAKKEKKAKKDKKAKKEKKEKKAADAPAAAPAAK